MTWVKEAGRWVSPDGGFAIYAVWRSGQHVYQVFDQLGSHVVGYAGTVPEAKRMAEKYAVS